MTKNQFHLVAPYQPTGDQPEAIEALTKGVLRGDRAQALVGVTGSGKTFTMANIIARCNRPTLVLAHNKTLAAQLCSEFREFFPDNAVEYFVSYYDYYQPEAYIPGKDLYIEKDSAVNDEIDRLRHSATSALFERRDVIIVSSVSCIYSLGDPAEYQKLVLALRPGMEMSMEELALRLISIQYTRNDISLERDKFRIRGDVFDIIREFPDVKGVMHSFSSSPEMARQYVKMGWFISFSGTVTFKNARKVQESVQRVPAHRILTETDCPYLTPVPHRGEFPNQPKYVKFALEKIAELRGQSTEELEKQIDENADRLFFKLK